MKMPMGTALMLALAWEMKNKEAIIALNREWFEEVKEQQKSE